MSCERQILYTYDTLDRLIEARHANGTVVRYSYDPAGNRTSVIVDPGADAVRQGAGDGATVTPVSAERPD
jgi:YD repeat-containing protein